MVDTTRIELATSSLQVTIAPKEHVRPYIAVRTLSPISRIIISNQARY